METKVSIDASRLRRHPADEALAFVDHILGPPGDWAPSLLAYRLTAEFQQDWKLEVGCWLLTARDFGFLDRLKSKIDRAFKRAKKAPGGGPNDKAHLIFNQELAPAMAVYYFTSLGWKFDAWEPGCATGDVDVRLRAPDGRIVDLQVKAPDQPGTLVDHQKVDGEYDERVLAALTKAIQQQLKNTPGPCRLAVVSPQRGFSIDAGLLVDRLVGFSTPANAGWSVAEADRRLFGTAVWLSGAADLHLVRGVDEVLYRCTVLLNPWCRSETLLSAGAFPYARVLSQAEGVFAWTPESPGR